MSPSPTPMATSVPMILQYDLTAYHACLSEPVAPHTGPPMNTSTMIVVNAASFSAPERNSTWR